MKIMLTGGAGLIGARMTPMLLDQGHEVAIYDAFVQFISPFASPYQSYLKNRFAGLEEKFTTFRGDTRDLMNLQRAIDSYRPEIIVHLAALPISDLANTHSEEALGSIVSGTTNCLEIMRERDFVKRFVYISSSMVYGDFEQEPCPEDHPLRPKEVYGGAKLAGEILTSAFARRFDLDVVIVRPSAVYGPTDVNRRVSQIFVENAILDKPLLLHNGGDSRLDFTFVDDIAQGVVLAALNSDARGETFNITTGQARSLKDFASVLQNILPNLEVKSTDADMFRPKRGALDISKAREILGYAPQYTLETGLPIYVDWCQHHIERPQQRQGAK